MLTLALAGSLLVAQAGMPDANESGLTVTAQPNDPVGFEPLMRGENLRAIADIEANWDDARDDPASLINLGVAYARTGREKKARELFRAALGGTDHMELETSTGDWVYSRALARRAIRMLEEGSLHSAQFAVR